MLVGNLEKYKKAELISEIQELRTEIERLKGHNARGAGRKVKREVTDASMQLQMVRMRNNSGESLESIAKSMGICRSTLYRLLKEDDVN